MAWDKVTITRDNGATAEAAAPVIVSASRSTDIPGFYAKWFFNRLERGYSAWVNPFNGVKSFVSYENTRFIVFWSKNPKPLIPYLEKLKENKIGCYVQYTLNDYEAEKLETGIPSLTNRIETFKTLSSILGKKSVIWRFDPLILTDRINKDDLLNKIEKIGNELHGFTEKLVFSFADIAAYRKVKSNLEANNIHYSEWTEDQMLEFCERLSALNKKNFWGYQLATCAEKPIFRQYGILPNRCIDDDLIIRISYKDSVLMDYLGVEIVQPSESLFGETSIPEGAIELPDGAYAVKHKDNKDKGQRKLCGCIISKDIGQYNTCAHLCEYCYANTSKDAAKANLKAHMLNPMSESILGE